jgi:NADPH:quinone reductase-like Zn-dependent oxidoreductase
MRAIVHRRFGSPDVLSLEDVPMPEPGDTEVLIKVEATTVGPPDCAARAADPVYARLAYGLVKPRFPVLGGIAAGEIEAVGTKVTGFSRGDQVVGVTGVSMGAHAEYVRIPHEGVVAKPGAVAHDDAIAVVDGGLTALPFLRDHADLRAGQTVLVNGASGSVGTGAVASRRLTAGTGSAESVPTESSGRDVNAGQHATVGSARWRYLQ